VLNHTRIHKDGYLRSEPRCKTQTKSMCYAKPGAVLRPKRLEMHGQAYLPSSIHLLRFSIELGQLDFRCRCRVRDWDIKLEIELVFEEVMNVPALSDPPSAVGVGGGDSEPVVVVGLVHRSVGDQGLVLLLQPLRPRRSVARTGFG